jgi:pyrroloquinoline quinone (PQQ) biosynthesis protein C
VSGFEARGFTITRSKESVSRLIPIAREGEEALRRLAEAHGMAPAKALEELVALVLGDEAAMARRMLRNPALAREALAAAFGTRGNTAA